jgi:hypothetical protein
MGAATAAATTATATATAHVDGNARRGRVGKRDGRGWYQLPGHLFAFLPLRNDGHVERNRGERLDVQRLVGQRLRRHRDLHAEDELRSGGDGEFRCDPWPHGPARQGVEEVQAQTREGPQEMQEEGKQVARLRAPQAIQPRRLYER